MSKQIGSLYSIRYSIFSVHLKKLFFFLVISSCGEKIVQEYRVLLKTACVFLHLLHHPGKKSSGLTVTWLSYHLNKFFPSKITIALINFSHDS